MRSLDDLVEDFELFDNWEDRYKYIIDLGKDLPEMDDSLKTDDNIVRGCTSRVWMQSDYKEFDDGSRKLEFIADSDAMIVRGLIHILMIAYQHKTPDQARGIDIEGYFSQLGLSEHLSPNRRNGFFSMVGYLLNQS